MGSPQRHGVIHPLFQAVPREFGFREALIQKIESNRNNHNCLNCVGCGRKHLQLKLDLRSAVA
jgi:hypothetical protein